MFQCFTTRDEYANMDLQECFTINNEYDNMDLQVSLPNLQELQLLMACISIEYLTCIYGFFRLCPSPNVEKLFIQVGIILSL